MWQFIHVCCSFGCVKIKFTYTKSTRKLSFSSFRTFSVPIFIRSSKISGQSLISFLIKSQKSSRYPHSIVDRRTHNLFQSSYRFNRLKMIGKSQRSFIHIDKNRFLCQYCFSRFQTLRPCSHV